MLKQFDTSHELIPQEIEHHLSPMLFKVMSFCNKTVSFIRLDELGLLLFQLKRPV